MFREDDGKMSFTRVMGTWCVAAMLVVFCYLAYKGDGETVRALGMEIALLAGALYGFNRVSGAWMASSATSSTSTTTVEKTVQKPIPLTKAPNGAKE